jgi:hypothetical protein
MSTSFRQSGCKSYLSVREQMNIGYAHAFIFLIRIRGLIGRGRVNVSLPPLLIKKTFINYKCRLGDGFSSPNNQFPKNPWYIRATLWVVIGGRPLTGSLPPLYIKKFTFNPLFVFYIILFLLLD